jgi:hypothetical protein
MTLSAENDFRALILGDPTLVTLVASRVYPDDYAQASASPAIRYTTISGSDEVHMQGTDGLWFDEIQVDIRALKATDRVAVRRALIAALNGFSGVQGSTDFQLIKHLSKLSRFEKTDAEAFYTDTHRFQVISRAAA